MKKQVFNLSKVVGVPSPMGRARGGVKQKVAFTLAEVLITLGVIGVVAAITMPTLIQHYQEKTAVNKLKKIYSVISQAYTRTLQENDSPDNWELGANGTLESSLNFIEKMKPYLKIIKVCEFDECLANYTFSNLNGTQKRQQTVKDRYWGYLSDGTLFSIYVYSNDCTFYQSDTDTKLQNVCAQIKVDITGTKAPNMYGKDIFNFYLTKNSVIPVGTVFDNGFVFSDRCNLSKAENNNGDGCAAWVIFNENMDYLHCNDLSWNGKIKCK